MTAGPGAPHDAPHDRPSDYVPFGAAGMDEAVSVAWPILLRDRITRRAQESPRFRWWVLWTVLAGLFSVNVTFTIFAVALPRIAGEFGTTTNTLIWVITGPMLAFGIVAPVLGKAGDLYGHRRTYLIGLGGAMVCSALSALAWSAGSLIAIRTIGAIEGAATGASSMALIFSEFDRDDRVKAMGWWSLVGAGGPVIGVALGGPLIEAVGWRWIFAAQVPLSFVALGLAAAVLKETPRGNRVRLDWAGAGTLALGVTSLLFGFNRGPDWGWTSPAVVAAFVLSPLALVAFASVERRAAEPLLPLAVVRRRNFALPIAASTFGNFAYMGGFILAPLLLGEVYGYGESRIGLFVLVRPLVFSLSAPIAGYLAVRVGERRSAVVGMSALVISMVMFTASTDGTVPALVLAALALSGLGLGCAQPSISSSVANAVDEDDLGIASAAQQLVAQVGVVAGIQLMSTIREQSGSFTNAYALGAAVSVLGVVCAAFLRSARRAGEPVDALREG
ncbi:MAG TPA: MFS transporter [Acidimicrobiales bacterium]